MKAKISSLLTTSLMGLFMVFLHQVTLAQNNTVKSSLQVLDRIEPPHWWVGMQQQKLQILVYAENIGSASVKIDYPGVERINTTPGKSNNYLFIDLFINQKAKPGTVDIDFFKENKLISTYPYELKHRKLKANQYQGFNHKDAIYLITPDRFANGNPNNDRFKTLAEKEINRNDDYARHGGDIQGIIDHLDYIKTLGFTALWASPLLINDMPEQSYHGYAITDLYRVDPRFGTLEEYKLLATTAREKGIKLIMDQVANHCGLNHWWMKDLPFLTG